MLVRPSIAIALLAVLLAASVMAGTATDKPVAPNKQSVKQGSSGNAETKSLRQKVDADLVDMIFDIEYLMAELNRLIGYPDENRRVLASLGGGGMDAGPVTPQFNSPSEQEMDDEVSLVNGVEISGFLDVIGSYQRSSSDRTEYGLGQAEIDLETELADNVSAAMAIAYNNETGGFELGAAEIGINLYTNDDGFWTSLNLVTGQFDVPFGIDWQVYPSPDRKLVNGPWLADVHGGWRGWNDFGWQVQLESKLGNFVGFWVNGFEESAEVIERVTNLATGLEEESVTEINTTPADAFGTRLGITPVSSLEIGGSFAIGYNESGKDEMTLLGADLQYSVFDFDLKGEYIYHSVNRSIEEENHQGWYFQSTYNFAPAFVVARYASFKPQGNQSISQVSLGAGYAIADGVELRLETLINEDSDAAGSVLQLVAGF